MSKRVEWIDFGKGFTIFLVVLGHVLLGMFQSGRFSETENNVMFLFVEIFYIFHMPVFFALSGYFFKTFDTTSDYLKSMRNKIISLGIPYIVFSVVMFVMKKIGSGTVRNETSVSALLGIYKHPIEHLWFLYILFGIFALFGFLSIFIKDKKILFGIAVCGYIVANFFPIPIYIIHRTLVWSPMFFIGSLLKGKKLSKNTFWISITAFAIYIAFWSKFNFDVRINYSEPGVWGIILPISVIMAFALFQNIKQSSFFNYFCKYGELSLPIYLIHSPVASVTRIVLFKLGINNIFIHIFIGITLGWFMSILIYKIATKLRIIDFVFYPLKYIK